MCNERVTVTAMLRIARRPTSEGQVSARADGAAQGGLPHALQHHILGLDGIRGLAAWAVVTAHAPNYGFMSVTNPTIGHYGVLLFFTLSGFLMGHLYMTKEFNVDNVRSYFAARVSRIVPLYYAVLLISFIVSHGVGHEFEYTMSTTTLLKQLAFVGHHSVFWSVAPEFQFYFIFPVFWWIASLPLEKKYNYLLLLVPLIFAAFFSRSYWPGMLLPSKLHIFLIGISIALFRYRIIDRLSRRAIFFLQIFAALLLILLVFPGDFLARVVYPVVPNDLKNNTYYQDFARVLLCAIIVFSFSLPTKFSEILLGNKFGRLSGKYSFSIYLLHVPVLHVLALTNVFGGMPRTMAILAAAVVIMAVAALSFHVYEDPSRSGVRKLLMSHLWPLRKTAPSPARQVI